MSFLVYLFLFLYIWKVEKSSYKNPEIAIETKTQGTGYLLLTVKANPFILTF